MAQTFKDLEVRTDPDCPSATAPRPQMSARDLARLRVSWVHVEGIDQRMPGILRELPTTASGRFRASALGDPGSRSFRVGSTGPQKRQVHLPFGWWASSCTAASRGLDPHPPAPLEKVLCSSSSLHLLP